MNNEDTVILDYFKDRKNGFYVDVGCYHPIHRNNTHLLHKKDWSGINIDTSEFSIDLFNHMRPKDLNYNCAVSNKNEIIKLFYQKELSQLSTTERNQAKTVFQGNIKEKDIQAFTLDAILNKGKFKNNKIDSVIALGESAAIAAMKAAIKNGLDIPRDISVIAFSNGILARHSSPKLTTVSQHGEIMGETAAKILIEKLEKKQSFWK
jgi:hypothetical protein